MTSFFTMSHASREARVSDDSARYAVKRGWLTPTARTSRGIALFDQAAIDAWLAFRKSSGQDKSQPEAA